MCFLVSETKKQQWLRSVNKKSVYVWKGVSQKYCSPTRVSIDADMSPYAPSETLWTDVVPVDLKNNPSNVGGYARSGLYVHLNIHSLNLYPKVLRVKVQLKDLLEVSSCGNLATFKKISIPPINSSEFKELRG
jgi:hypothetical protein